ncbi:histidinol-phosphate transaminase [Portibacter lacus]|uniref:Histidinol-phosphate aminotransferase n=1 Tax=Portibacter lacus TaxID=1099794 RepID=A0AA37SNE8_9BACT|nr:histidinol-phosphate transaminase [Portibacter lacus]GLR16312.1 histidinol-phosphate aminotransferase [Portibacter lacus]
MKEIERLIRPELLNLKPYSSARSEFHGQADIFVDANENPFENKINRYPDPLQKELKSKISEMKGVDPSCIFLGNGSDEALDLIFRLFCIPGKDEVIITPPTYGMYKVLANINNIFVKEAALTTDFQIVVDSILKQYDRETKILFLCSPNNPVGNVLNREDVINIIDQFPGIVVIDEAYIDFSATSGFLDLINEKPNLIITQTFSKAWGMAGIRLGMAFSNPFIIDQINKIKPPYNINVLTQKVALEKLNDEETFKKNLASLKSEKLKLAAELDKMDVVKKIYESDANFLLVKFDDADHYYKYLLDHGIVVRNRSNQFHCKGCLRITIGTPEENDKLIKILKK